MRAMSSSRTARRIGAPMSPWLRHRRPVFCGSRSRRPRGPVAPRTGRRGGSSSRAGGRRRLPRGRGRRVRQFRTW
eukprot:12774672-Alexandrium_andersonii.AAC.1